MQWSLTQARNFNIIFGTPLPLLLCTITYQVMLFLLNIYLLFSTPTAAILVHFSPDLWKKVLRDILNILSFSSFSYNNQCSMSHIQTRLSLYFLQSFSVQNSNDLTLLFFKSHFIPHFPWKLIIELYWISFSSMSDSDYFIHRMLHKYLLYLEDYPLILYLANSYSPLILSLDIWNLAPGLSGYSSCVFTAPLHSVITFSFYNPH